MDVEVRQLRALVAVVDEGTFTDAAITLGLSQASVSRAVAALERATGVRLLARTSREVHLTTPGHQVVGHARRVLAEIAAVQRVAREEGAQLRVGYAWSALGRHTTSVQQRWTAEQPGSELLFVQSNTRTAGLREGTAQIAILRRAVSDARIETVLVGSEPRYAAVAASDVLARKRSLRLSDFAGRTIGIDEVTGTTSEQLWPAGGGPSAVRQVHGVDEWLTVIAAGQALGMTSQATARQHPRPGVVYRPVRDAAEVPVWLAWRRDDPPDARDALVRLVRGCYGSYSPPPMSTR